MDQKTLIERLVLVVLDGLGRDLASYWHHPPGRMRSETRTKRSEWLASMSATDRELLEAFGDEAGRSALFGVLAVLDGARKIAELAEGHLELRHVSGETSEILASSAIDSRALPLHELLP